MKKVRELKSLESLKNAKMTVTVVNERFPGDSRPATEDDIRPVREAFAAALRQGNVTINGKPITPLQMTQATMKLMKK